MKQGLSHTVSHIRHKGAGGVLVGWWGASLLLQLRLSSLSAQNTKNKRKMDVSGTESGRQRYRIAKRREAAFIKAISLHTLGFVLGLWRRPRPNCVRVSGQ